MSTPPPLSLTNSPADRVVHNGNIHLGALTTVSVWHDYLCPWCYVALIQVERLKKDYGIRCDWRGAELFPPSLNFTPSPPKPVDPNAPPPPPAPPSRFDLFVEAEGMVMPTPRPPFVSTHSALLASEYALIEHGQEKGDAFVEAVYRAYWERQENISDNTVLEKIAESVGIPAGPLLESVAAGRYSENILEFDDDAYATGIRHVPTFIFGGEERLAEAPYTDLARAAERFLIRTEKYKGK